MEPSNLRLLQGCVGRRELRRLLRGVQKQRDGPWAGVQPLVVQPHDPRVLAGGHQQDPGLEAPGQVGLVVRCRYAICVIEL
ncbi:hypothetical protein BSKO_02859 [Bryopsis sp. KO-2023]|nr:hypothetical protein BSKO_02859 [Bryopsis sp. KO-2023]